VRRSAFAPPSPCRALIVFLGILALFAVLGPADANVVPSAMVYFNVVPGGPPGAYCQTSIWECEQIQPTTPEQGLVEFQVFVATTLGSPVTSFSADLIWPDEWTLVDGDYCRGGQGTFQYWGSNPHHLEITWPCTSHHYLFMALDLVFDVHGYGKLTTNDPSIWIGCPPAGYSVYAAAMFGEAGTECEYTDQPCADNNFACEPNFASHELALTSPAGGSAHGEILFSASWGHLGQYGCHGAYSALTGAAWCAAQVRDGETQYRNILVIDADAAELDPGLYETWVQVRSSTLARCVEVALEVVEPTAARSVTWGMVKALYR
jgi:hypothetical protein